MQIPFVKYHGTGNDFILIDDRSSFFSESKELISRMCDRHFGIGADGLLLLRNHADLDFEMIYYNSDGSPATFCGNGGRCIVAFAQALELIGNSTTFMAADGVHQAEIPDDNGHTSMVKLSMQAPVIYEQTGIHCYLNTGTWHYVEWVPDVDEVDLLLRGREIRYSEKFSPHGTNVNFACLRGESILVRTYEKGVEDETLSCGTGVTACAIAAALRGDGSTFHVLTKGGELGVSLRNDGKVIDGVYLSGPAVRVFEGQFSIQP